MEIQAEETLAHQLLCNLTRYSEKMRIRENKTTTVEEHFCKAKLHQQLHGIIDYIMMLLKTTSNPEQVRLVVLTKLQEALDEEAILKEQFLALMHRFADRKNTYPSAKMASGIDLFFMGFRCFSSRICGLRFDVVLVEATRSSLNIFSFLSIVLVVGDRCQRFGEANYWFPDPRRTDHVSSIVSLSEPRVVFGLALIFADLSLIDIVSILSMGMGSGKSEMPAVCLTQKHVCFFVKRAVADLILHTNNTVDQRPSSPHRDRVCSVHTDMSRDDVSKEIDKATVDGYNFDNGLKAVEVTDKRETAIVWSNRGTHVLKKQFESHSCLSVARFRGTTAIRMISR
nr:hypothetical protein [Tanacetum cinerariifolium]